mmetsp:Transcript_3941/g.3835  ORF Transcript_3941/g.3835 Transcript_3941/m.3835 type:complete len:213 (-) Transcript_3941:3636-4274(-)
MSQPFQAVIQKLMMMVHQSLVSLVGSLVQLVLLGLLLPLKWVWHLHLQISSMKLMKQVENKVISLMKLMKQVENKALLDHLRVRVVLMDQVLVRKLLDQLTPLNYKMLMTMMMMMKTTTKKMRMTLTQLPTQQDLAYLLVYLVVLLLQWDYHPLIDLILTRVALIHLRLTVRRIRFQEKILLKLALTIHQAVVFWALLALTNRVNHPHPKVI